MFSPLMYKPFPPPSHQRRKREREEKQKQKQTQKQKTKTWVVVNRRLRTKKPCLDAKIESSTWKSQCLHTMPLPPRTLLMPRISRTLTPPSATMLIARFLTPTTTRTRPLLCLLLLILILLHHSQRGSNLTFKVMGFWIFLQRTPINKLNRSWVLGFYFFN